MMRVISYTSSRARHVAIGHSFCVHLSRSRATAETAFACLARWPDQPKLASAGVSQPARERRLVGLTRFELVTPRLSSVCSNQLSYRPVKRVSKNRDHGSGSLKTK